MQNLLEVRNLKKWFPLKAGLLSKTVAQIKAVDDISFELKPGETFGLVGESGCGKSTTGRVILRLLEPTAGQVLFGDVPVFELPEEGVRKLRRDMQIIFQDPYASLNSRQTVGSIVGEPLFVHGLMSRAKIRERARELLETVGLGAHHIDRYPHEFSGGQRQRIGIARALALNPRFIVCDEPVSALDVSIQSQVLNLLRDLQERFGLTYLFISHDLSVIKHISDRIGVMYLGKLVEVAPKKDLFATPLHPYTRALLSAIPTPDPNRRPERIILQGDVPSPIDPPPGCRFAGRCYLAQPRCREEEPMLQGGHHKVACHLAGRS